MTLRLLFLALLAPLLMGQAGPRLVPDISARSIEIRYSFTGAQLLLFGAILYPGGRTPTRPLDVVVVLKGPVQPMVVREKQKIAGIWMNADSHRFVSAPSYYAVASNRPLLAGVNPRATYKALLDARLGLYQEVATLVVETDNLSVDEVVAVIVNRLGLA